MNKECPEFLQSEEIINELAAIGFIPPEQYIKLLKYPNPLKDNQFARAVFMKIHATREIVLGWQVFEKDERGDVDVRWDMYTDISLNRSFRPCDIDIIE